MGDPGIEEKDVSTLHLNHANIKHRKNFLRAYLDRLLKNGNWNPESRFWEYLDNVGLVHTGKQQTSRQSTLRVEYAHIAMLLAWLQDTIVGVLMDVKEEEEGKANWTLERKVEVLRAFGKVWWVQNDLFARHYCDDWDLKGGKGRSKGWTERSAVQIVLTGAVSLVTGAILAGCLLT
jgi:Protoglobin